MITITNEAKEYLNKVREGGYVTLSIIGGGCSGFQYVWGLSNEINEEYTEIDNILLLDRMAEMYVLGSEIDYVTELGGSFLKVVNPTSTSSCGCGESFGV